MSPSGWQPAGRLTDGPSQFAIAKAKAITASTAVTTTTIAIDSPGATIPQGRGYGFLRAPLEIDCAGRALCEDLHPAGQTAVDSRGLEARATHALPQHLADRLDRNGVARQEEQTAVPGVKHRRRGGGSWSLRVVVGRVVEKNIVEFPLRQKLGIISVSGPFDANRVSESEP